MTSYPRLVERKSIALDGFGTNGLIVNVLVCDCQILLLCQICCVLALKGLLGGLNHRDSICGSFSYAHRTENPRDFIIGEGTRSP